LKILSDIAFLTWDKAKLPECTTQINKYTTYLLIQD